jgi:hypothetical protein
MHRDVVDVAGDPYVRTLWTFFHLEQHERVDDIKLRGRALQLGGLMAIAFHEPKRLNDEQRRLLADAGMLPSPDAAKERATPIIAAVAAMDRAEGKIP